MRTLVTALAVCCAAAPGRAAVVTYTLDARGPDGDAVRGSFRVDNTALYDGVLRAGELGVPPPGGGGFPQSWAWPFFFTAADERGLRFDAQPFFVRFFSPNDPVFAVDPLTGALTGGQFTMYKGDLEPLLGSLTVYGRPTAAGHIAGAQYWPRGNPADRHLVLVTDGGWTLTHPAPAPPALVLALAGAGCLLAGRQLGTRNARATGR